MILRSSRRRCVELVEIGLAAARQSGHVAIRGARRHRLGPANRNANSERRVLSLPQHAPLACISRNSCSRRRNQTFCSVHASSISGGAALLQNRADFGETANKPYASFFKQKLWPVSVGFCHTTIGQTALIKLRSWQMLLRR